MAQTSKNLVTVIASIVAALIFIIITSTLPLPPQLQSLLFDKPTTSGGSFFPYPFTIQNLMWLVFFLALGELYKRMTSIKRCHHSLRQQYLPEEEGLVLTNKDMGGIYRKMKSKHGDLENIIKSLVLRFQAGKSVEQTHEMLTSQLEMWQYRLENDYNMIRYLSWLLPTLGFIGTVVGIAFTLNWAGSGEMAPDNPLFLSQLTSRLGVAFYTTLLALSQSAVLVFLIHLTQGAEERAIAKTGQYCLDSLITRLYIN